MHDRVEGLAIAQLRQGPQRPIKRLRDILDPYLVGQRSVGADRNFLDGVAAPHESLGPRPERLALVGIAVDQDHRFALHREPPMLPALPVHLAQTAVAMLRSAASTLASAAPTGKTV